ncbi:MAG: phosphopentomutase [Roseiarcus sp.]
MTRAILIVLDSVGCGGAEDAASYGDEGADTLGHIAQACAMGLGDRYGLRSGPLKLPRLESLGLGEAMKASTGRAPAGFALGEPRGQWGYGIETSRGKDTPSGHWELAGAPVDFDWGYFPETIPAFPGWLTEAMIAEGELAGILANRHASGTAVIEDYGEEHLRTLQPICYTSADSVLQIATHEGAFGLERLYALCRLTRKLCDKLKIGRVIARPFLGASASDFVRTANRKDFALPPPDGNLLQRAARAGRPILSIGKIGDIFAHRDTGVERKGKSNDGNIDLLLDALATTREGGLIFVNLVDFDTEWGHRRDVPGYAACLEAFDARLGAIEAAMRPTDYCVITADHGNDPTYPGFDHTREHVPILAFGAGAPAGAIGVRSTLADVAETIAQKLGLPRGPHGRAWAG